MVVEGYTTDKKRPVKFRVDIDLTDKPLSVMIYAGKDDTQGVDVTSVEFEFTGEPAGEENVVMCDFATNEVPSGVYFMVVRTPDIVCAKGVLTLYDMTGFGL